MKLKRDDKVMVMVGRDKGQTGKVLALLPRTGQVVVEGVNVIKRHTKPSQKSPRGGIIEITKPIDVSKLMAVDPATGKPARIGYEINKSGVKERVFKVSHAMQQIAPKPKSKKAGKAKVENEVEDTKANSKGKEPAKGIQS